MLTPAIDWNSAPARCGELPLPGDAYVIWPGRSFASAISRLVSPDMADGTQSSIAVGKLKSFVERVEKLEAEKAELTADIREVYSEAKGNGYDVTALRAVIRLRKQDKDERAEHEAILETYKAALGMMGLLDPVFRLPLVPPSPQNHAKIENVLKSVGLLAATRSTHAD